MIKMTMSLNKSVLLRSLASCTSEGLSRDAKWEERKNGEAAKEKLGGLLVGPPSRARPYLR